MPRRYNPSAFFARIMLGYAVLTGALVLVLRVVDVFQRGTIGRDIETDGRRQYGGDAVRAAEGAWANWNGTGSFGVSEPSLGVALIGSLPSLVFSAAVIVVAWLVFRVVVDVQLRVPFGAVSERRLRVASMVAAGATVLYALCSAWADVAVFHAAVVGESGGPSFIGSALENLLRVSGWFLVSALLAAFAQAFGEGQRLASETEGLV